MTFIRREVREWLVRRREVLIGLGLVAAGSWIGWLGGYFFVPLGLFVMAIGVGWTVLAIRRLRFDQPGEAPGMVEVDEGQISYFGPTMGGAVGLPELVEIRLMTLRGRRIWRLKQADGQAMLIPIEAAGAERLFDAFSALPGMDTSALVAALQSPTTATGTALSLDGEARLVWQRTARGIVVR